MKALAIVSLASLLAIPGAFAAGNNTHTGSPPKSTATSPTTPKATPSTSANVSGKIVSFDAKTGMLVMDHFNQRRTIYLDPHTAVTIDGKAGSAADLKPGDEVVLTTHENQGKTYCSTIVLNHHQAKAGKLPG